MPTVPTTRNAITAALKECDPMSVMEIAEHLGMRRNRVNTAMTTARGRYPGKWFRIVRYRKQIGVSGRETPVYSASKGPDAPRPDFGEAHRLERNDRYYQQNRARLFIERQVRAGVPAASPWAGLIPIERRVTRSAQHPAQPHTSSRPSLWAGNAQKGFPHDHPTHHTHPSPRSTSPGRVADRRRLAQDDAWRRGGGKP